MIESTDVCSCRGHSVGGSPVLLRVSEKEQPPEFDWAWITAAEIRRRR
jgi:hypothetical protein